MQFEVPLLEAAEWALSSGSAASCAANPAFDNCTRPWSAVEAWQYATANILCAVWRGAPKVLDEFARTSAIKTTRFFAKPDPDRFAEAAAGIVQLRRTLSGSDGGQKGPVSHPKQTLTIPSDAGIGVPFPLASVLLPRDPAFATMQLRRGRPMPLLGMAVPRRRKPSIAGIAAALTRGVRHLDFSPASAHAVESAIRESGVARKDLFLSMVWEPPLDSVGRLDDVLRELGTSYVDLLQVPRGPDHAAQWRIAERLLSRRKVNALGVRDFLPEELDGLPSKGAAVELLQCSFTPYRPGPTRAAWRLLGGRSVALVASGLLSDWPRALRPLDDPHVKAVAARAQRSPAQVLIRWALQMGLAVVFRASRAEHIAENLGVFDFALADADMQLLASLATLAEPRSAPGDGFARVYEPGRTQRAEL